MLLRTRKDGAPARRFSAWSLALWIVLLLAAYAGMQYLQHGDFVYLAAAFVMIVITVGCVLRQAWARRAMRVAAPALALYALISAGLIVWHWDGFEQARQQAMADPRTAPLALMMIEQTQRVYRVVLALKAIGIPFVLWLGWRLGKPDVIAEFHERKSRKRNSASVRM